MIKEEVIEEEEEEEEKETKLENDSTKGDEQNKEKVVNIVNGEDYQEDNIQKEILEE